MRFFDSHLHIIDPRFPLVPNQGYMPDAFTCNDYLQRTEELEVLGGAIGSGSFQAFDQSYLIDALKILEKNFVGVTQILYDMSDQKIKELNELGVRGLRFNVNRGGSEDLAKFDYLSRRVHDLVGWHIEEVRVAYSARGKGIGTMLINWAINRAKKRGCHLIQLTTNKKRKDALRFYERLGFTATHEGLKQHI